MSTLPCTALLAALFLPTAPAAEPFVAAEPAVAPQRRRKEKEIPRVPKLYDGDLASARKDSLERNAVLLVIAIQEGEEANDRFYDAIYKHPQFISATLGTIVLGVNDGEHPTTKVTRVDEEGKKTEVEVCSFYETKDCAAHKRSWTRVFQEFNEDGAMRTPQVVVLMPDAKIRERFVDLHAITDFTRSIAAAKELAGPSLTPEQLSQARRLHGAATTLAGEEKWPQAYGEWKALAELVTAGTFAEAAAAGTQAALDAMKAMIAGAVKAMEAGRVVEGYQELVALEPVLEDTPLERELAKTIRQAERNKEWREAIEKHKRSLEAEELWKEIEALINEDQIARAKRIGALILRKYGDTPAAERVRKEFPDLEE